MNSITIFILAVLIFLTGCAMMPSVCDKPNVDSVLCDVARRHGVRLETIGDILMVVNLRIIKQGAYTAEQSKMALLAMQAGYHKVGAAGGADFSAANLRALVMSYANNFPELILLRRYIDFLKIPDILKPADIEMLDRYIDEQIRVIDSFS